MMKILEIAVEDWCLYIRTPEGIYFAIVESDGRWLDTPSRGEAAFGTAADNLDWQMMMDWALEFPESFSWEPACFIDTDGSDISVTDIGRMRLHRFTS